MERSVIDSSVAIKWFVVEPYSREARALLDEYQTGELDLLAPDLIYAEVGNIVWKKHRLQGLAVPDAQSIIDTFCLIKFNVTATAVLLTDAYHLAVAHQRTVYDALYIALSLRESCKFITADEKLVNAIGGTFPNVIWIGKP